MWRSPCALNSFEDADDLFGGNLTKHFCEKGQVHDLLGPHFFVQDTQWPAKLFQVQGLQSSSFVCSIVRLSDDNPSHESKLDLNPWSGLKMGVLFFFLPIKLAAARRAIKYLWGN